MLRGRLLAAAAAASSAASLSWCAVDAPPPPAGTRRQREPRHSPYLSRLDKNPRQIVLPLVLDGSCTEWDGAGLERRSCGALRARLQNALLLAGSSNPLLAEEVGYESGLMLGRIAVEPYADGEIGVQILDNVRGKDVYVLQSATPPIADSIIETLLIISAARRASAKTITLVAPSLPYGQDVGTVASLGHLARHGLVANAVAAAGADMSGVLSRDAMMDELEGEGTTVLDAGALAGLQAGPRAQHATAAEHAAAAAAVEAALVHNVRVGAAAADATELTAASSLSHAPRTTASPISASDIARLYTSAGVDRVLSIDLAPPGKSQLEGFFPPNVPVESLRSARICMDTVSRLGLHNVTVVAPHEDVIQLATEFRTGLAERAAGRALAGGVDAAATTPNADAAATDDVGFAVIVETGSSGRDRYGKETSRKNRVFHLIGDVQDRDVVLADLVVDTAKTLCDRVALLKAHGARRIVAVAPHAMFSGQALQRINRSPLELVVVSNSIPLRAADARYTHKVMQLSIAPLLASAIVRVQAGLSLAPLRTASGTTMDAVIERGDVRYLGQE